MAGRAGAEIIVDHLISEGVPYAVGLCGHGDLGLLDALYSRQGKIKTISVHHESVAGFIADAYFRVVGKPLATFTSCGPGSANMPVAVGSAMMDDSAMFVITGNVPTTQFNRGPFQETGRYYQAEFSAILRPYVKRSYQATRAEQLPLMLQQGFALMLSGRPGPVHLDVPLDIFVEKADGESVPRSSWVGTGSGKTGASAADLEAFMALLASAKKPVIVAGSGVEGDFAENELLAFAEGAGIPVATSPLGKSAIDNRHALALGPTGRNGTLSANKATRNADVVLAFGTRFDDRSTSSWLPGYTYDFSTTKLVHVHIDPAELGRNFPATIAIAASPREVLRQLAEAVSASSQKMDFGPWLEVVAKWKAEWAEVSRAAENDGNGRIAPQAVLRELRAAMDDDGILLSDVGIHHNWIVQNWEARAPRSVLQSWGFASMGFGLGGVMGAHLAAPDRQAVAVVGDGGFLMHSSVVATAVEYDMPVVWVIWNNGGYMSIRDQQKMYFGKERQIATTFLHDQSGAAYDADFVALARSMGADGIRVDSADQLAAAFKTALDAKKPFVVDVRVDDTAGLPAVATWELPPLDHPAPGVGWPDQAIGF